MSHDPSKPSEDLKDLEEPGADNDLPQAAKVPQEVQNENKAAEDHKIALDSAGIDVLLNTLIEGLGILKNEMYVYYSDPYQARVSLNAQMQLITALKKCIADVIFMYIELKESENRKADFIKNISDATADNKDKENI